MRKEKVQTTNDILNTIKKSGLDILLVDQTKPEAKEHCAYQSCERPVIFTMESLFVCEEHAISLMHCFIPHPKSKK